MLGAGLFRGVKVHLGLLSAFAVACGAMTVEVPEALAADSSPTLTAKAVAPVPGAPDNQEVSKENLKDAVVKVHLEGLETGKRYSLEAVAYDAHDPKNPRVWDEEDNPIYFTPPPEWQSENATVQYPFELIVEQPLDFTAKGTEQDLTVNIGNPLKMFARFDETLDELIDHRKFVVVTRLREFHTHDPSKPVNETRRELALNPVLAVSPERDSAPQVIEDSTLTAVRELSLAPSSSSETTTSSETSTKGTSAEEAPKAEEPKAEKPKGEEPKGEEPKAEEPKGDSQEDNESTSQDQDSNDDKSTQIGAVGDPAGTTDDKASKDSTKNEHKPSADTDKSDQDKSDISQNGSQNRNGTGSEEAGAEGDGAEGDRAENANSQDSDSAAKVTDDNVKSAQVYAFNEDGEMTHEVTPQNTDTVVQRLEMEGLEPEAEYNVETYMRANDVDGDYISDGSSKQPMPFSATPVTADDSGNLTVEVPLSNLANDDFEVPFAEGQDELKAVVQNKVVADDGDTEGKSASESSEIFTYPNASTPDSEVEKQTLTFSRDAWDDDSGDRTLTDSESEGSGSEDKAAYAAGTNDAENKDADGNGADETKANGEDADETTAVGKGAAGVGASATDTAAADGGASSSKLPGKQDTASSSTQSNDESLAKKLSNGTKVMPGGDVAPGSPAQNVGKTQNTTVNTDSKNVSLSPQPKDSAVTITSDAGIVGGKLTKGAVVVDNVSFTGLRPDTDYALKGELMCVTTQKPTGAANSITFRTPKSDKPTVDGSTVISIPVLSDDCSEQAVVETLYEAVPVGNGTFEAGNMIATTAGKTFTAGATVTDGKTATPAVVTQQVQPAKGVGTQPSSSVRVIKSEKSPSTVTTTGSVRKNVGAALEPQAQRVVVSNVPSGPSGLSAQSAPFIE